jgi:hypothetical protein
VPGYYRAVPPGQKLSPVLVFGISSRRDDRVTELTVGVSHVAPTYLRTERPFIEREAVSPRLLGAHVLNVLDEELRVSGDP